MENISDKELGNNLGKFISEGKIDKAMRIIEQLNKMDVEIKFTVTPKGNDFDGKYQIVDNQIKNPGNYENFVQEYRYEPLVEAKNIGKSMIVDEDVRIQQLIDIGFT